MGISICAAAGALWIAVVFLLTQGAATPQPWTAGAAKVLPAALNYAKVLKAEGAPVPAYVEAKQLFTRGLLGQDDLRPFAGMAVSVSTSQDRSRPDDVLIRARQWDGTEVVLLVDGSVHTQ